MKSIFNETLEKLESYFINNSDKKFRASQVFEWLYKKRVTSFDEMSNLKKEVIEKLKEDFELFDISIENIQSDEEVNKLLFKTSDSNYVEAVLMHHDYGKSICISTQVGCNMGCKFCESGRLKKVRNLTTAEMLEQILLTEKELNVNITRVVLMGIGEPFDNYDNVIDLINIMNHHKALEIGSRHITLSTCGVIPKIKEFSKLPYQVNLAISLHAPNDEIRNKIMPINKVYPLKELMKSIKEYIAITNRRVTFEYIMLKDINDNEDCAKELSKLLFGINCYVNIIPYNETNNIDFKKSNLITINRFYDILKKNNIAVTIRREFGNKISAACGQLRSEKETR